MPPIPQHPYVWASHQATLLSERGGALHQENYRIWPTYYKPKRAHDHIADWQAYLEWYRQVVVEVLEIAAETGWRGQRSG